MTVSEAGREARTSIAREDARQGRAGAAVELDKPFERHATEHVPVVGEWLAGKLFGTAKNAAPDETDLGVDTGSGKTGERERGWGDQSP